MVSWVAASFRGGRGVLPEKFGGGMWAASQNPYPVYG